MAKEKSITNLNTTGDLQRAHLTIDGESFEIINVKELGLKEQQRLFYTATFLQEYFNKEANAADDAKAAKLLATGVSTILPDLPADVAAKLNDNQKFEVIHAFRDANEEAQTA